jgi:peptide/nickel transport system permease protein
MLAFIARRIGSGIVLIFVVTALTFLLVSPSEKGVARALLGTTASERDVLAENARLGLDRPLIVQYWDWLTHALQGNLGTSWFTSEPVSSALASRIPVTLSVVVVAMVFTAVLSLALGVSAAIRDGALGRVLQLVSLVGYAIPALLIAIVLVAVFAVNLQWFSATGYTPLTDSFAGWLGSVVLPAVALTIGGVAGLAAQIRGAMVDELRKDYVRTLRSRGISQRAVIFRHALRNAGAPSLTIFSLQFIGTLGGAVIIERVFALPGYGQFSASSSLEGDIPVIMGVVAFTVILVVVVNLVIELAISLLNPKTRRS